MKWSHCAHSPALGGGGISRIPEFSQFSQCVPEEVIVTLKAGSVASTRFIPASKTKSEHTNKTNLILAWKGQKKISRGHFYHGLFSSGFHFQEKAFLLSRRRAKSSRSLVHCPFPPKISIPYPMQIDWKRFTEQATNLQELLQTCFHWGFVPFIIVLGIRSMRPGQSWLALIIPTPYLTDH